MAVIIFEGPDGSGKSTTIEKVSEYLNFPSSHDGGPSRDAEHCRERIDELLRTARRSNAIKDRSTVFSDAIYKEAFGKEPFVPYDEVYHRIWQLSGLGAIVVYCRPPMQTLINNIPLLARAKPHKPPEYAEQLKSLVPTLAQIYDREVMKWSALGLPVIRYDFTENKVEDLLSALGLFWDDHLNYCE